MQASTLFTSALVGLCFGLMPMLGQANAYGAPVQQIAGSLEFVSEGKLQTLAAVSSEYEIDIDGDIANIKVIQTFSNPTPQPVHARYLFPLNRLAAVHQMRMTSGNEVVEAQIQELGQAKRTYAKAKAAGKGAALLQQHRPNMFTQTVANLMPGAPVQIELAYVQPVTKVDSGYELVVPTLVGPRYQPAANIAASDEQPGQAQWHYAPTPAQAPVVGVHLPTSVAAVRLRLAIELRAGQPIHSLTSNTHEITIQASGPQQRSVRLAAADTLANRDFVLRYELGDDQVSVGALSHWQAPVLATNDERVGHGYFSLLVEPPTADVPRQVLPREVVFLLDCSGSMSGLPMQASKSFMRHALGGLTAKDSFRIVRFSDVATEFSQQPLPATPDNVRQGLAYTEALQGSGGTVMTSGIFQALSAPATPGQVRQVVFLTDGYIGNEMQILQLVQQHLGQARLYSFGVGTGVNRYLLEELANVGRGFARYLPPGADAQEVAAALAARIQAPLLTDLQVDWGELPVRDITPTQLPDLFAGEAVRLVGRFDVPVAGQITVSGRGPDGQRIQLQPWLELTEQPGNPALAQTWARAQIHEAMHQFASPQPLRALGANGQRLSNHELQAQITHLGLAHRLVTQWTAFVAVSKTVVNPAPQATPNAEVALAAVAGVAAAAYPPAGANYSAFTGYGTPEPSALLSLGVVVVLLALWWAWVPRPQRAWMRL